MGVQIMPMSIANSEDIGQYVAVRTHPDPGDDTVTLVTIQVVVERTVVRNPTDSNWHVKNLLVDKPMSFDAALGFATCYAERKNIPVIYANED